MKKKIQRDENTLCIEMRSDKTEGRQIAEAALSPLALNAFTAKNYSHGSFGLTDINECVAVVKEKADKVLSGDLTEVESTLTAQATALNAIFNEMARRAALNMGEYMDATERYMRLALKAQAQCRSTLETLAEIKAPRAVAFVKQANISHGPQQVNNNEARARENVIDANELSRGSYEQLLPDTRTQSIASQVNPEVETVGAIYRPTDGRREGS